MKILMPFSLTGIGGVRTFAQKFKEGMHAQGHEVVFEYDGDYDVLFMVVQCPLKYLLHAKRHKKKIVQRLDGTFNWSAVGWKFPLLNAKATYIRHLFTDFSVYQSEFSRLSANRFLGKKWRDRSAIIYNGVDTELFSPDGVNHPDLRDHPQQKLFFTASAFRRKDQIAPILAALDNYQKKYGSDYKFVVAGTFTGAVADYPEILKKRSDVQFLGPIKNADLAAYERSVDVFLFTHLNPPCPNNVIEALACGLPICGVADGAMPELVMHQENGMLIPARGSGFWRQRDFDAAAFADNLHTIVQNQKKFATASRKAAVDHYPLAQMIHSYTAVFKSMLE